jgi:hypothetical protein
MDGGTIATVSTTRRVASLAALGGAIGAVVVDALYVNLVFQQGVLAPGGRVPFVAAWIAVAALLAGWGAFLSDPLRRALALGIAGALLLVLAYPAIFSIGIPLFLCAVPIAVGAVRAAQQGGATATALLVALPVLVLAGGLLALGFVLTRS